MSLRQSHYYRAEARSPEIGKQFRGMHAKGRMVIERV